MNEYRLRLPMVALRGITILPGMVAHFDVSREKSRIAVEEAMLRDKKLFLITQKEVAIEEPTREDLYDMGIVVEVNQVLKLPGDLLRVMIVGENRARLLGEMEVDGTWEAEVAKLGARSLEDVDDISMEGMIRGLKEMFLSFSRRNGKITKEQVQRILGVDSLETLMMEMLVYIPMNYKELQEYLEEESLVKIYEKLAIRLTNEMNILDVKNEFERKVKERVDKHQKEYFLREQLAVIREELGDDTTLSDADEFAEKAKQLRAPEEVKEKLEKEIRRFRNAMNSPAESGVIRTYIETILDMPWEKRQKENQDLRYAKQVLEEDHYGLEEVKNRVLEFLAVRTLTQKGESPILCLVGPPGTGKTSIAKSLARALKVPYERISLGGVRDEAEIRGHRKTYVGAMPGRIATAVKRSGVKNPLILLDEIDKVSNDYKGDTFSALLEVLDGEQNSHFRDHYLEVPLDLSEVLFIATANTLQTIPRPLLDRMELIEVNSYTDNEKLHIAKEHLIPKQLQKNGLTKEQLTISDPVIESIEKYYIREAGVRQLERKIGEICRKAAREILEKKTNKIQVTRRNLKTYLGREKYSIQMKNKEDAVGIVRGLAWTSVGGDTLEIEVSVLRGKGEITLTGQMGDVMKESAITGVSYIRSIAQKYAIDAEFFEKHDFHIHIPEGAVPKDGPSAGITMATAILSAITDVKVKADLAMTGEITLRGRVLPIGGLKEKLLAAKNAGIHTVLVPDANKKEVEGIAKEITGSLTVHYVSTMEDVISHAFVKEEKHGH